MKAISEKDGSPSERRGVTRREALIGLGGTVAGASASLLLSEALRGKEEGLVKTPIVFGMIVSQWDSPNAHVEGRPVEGQEVKLRRWTPRYQEEGAIGEVAYTTTTNEDGLYIFPGVQPGSYSVELGPFAPELMVKSSVTSHPGDKSSGLEITPQTTFKPGPFIGLINR